MAHYGSFGFPNKGRRVTKPVLEVKPERFTPPGGWNPEFQNVFNFVVNGTGNGCVEAVAGGGKTTAVVEAIMRAVEKNSNQRILFVAFNVSIKDEGAKRLRGWGCEVMTCHGLGFSSLRKPSSWGGPDSRKQFDVQDHRGAYMQSLVEAELGSEKEKADDRESLMDLISKAKTTLTSSVGGMIDLMDRFGIETSYDRSDFAEKALKIMQFTAKRPGTAIVPGYGKSKGKNFSKAAITFDDEIWLPIVNNWYIDKYDMIFVDEAQDLSPARRELIKRALRPGGRLIVVGDRYQCVDRYTPVKTPSGDVYVTDLKPGDTVLSWRNNVIAEQTVRHVQKSDWREGVKVTTVSGKTLLMSPNHRIWASSNTIATNKRLLIKIVAHSSKNTILSFEWSESSYPIKDNLEAAGFSVKPAKKAGRFRVRKWYPNYRDAIANAEKIQNIIPNSFIVEKLHTPTECLNLITASCIHVGMRVAVFDNGSISTEEIISVERAEGEFYDIDVDDASNFFGGDILSHNCIYAFSGADIDSLPTLIEEFDCKMLPLSCSWRCDSNIVREAQQFNPNIVSRPNADDGIVDKIEVKDVLSKLKEGDVLLSRTNAPLVRIFFQLARQQRKVKFIGRDYGRMLAYRIKSWRFRHEAKVSKGEASGMFTGRVLLSYNDEWLEIQSKNDNVKINDRQKDEHATIIALTLDLRSSLDSEHSIKEVLDRCSAFSPDEKPEENDGNTYITLSSTHRFKGLERDHAYVLIDTYKAGESQEEANLIYVAVTRAKRHLTYVAGKPNATEEA